MVKEFINRFLRAHDPHPRRGSHHRARAWPRLTAVVSLQLNEVMHHPAFQKLEARARHQELSTRAKPATCSRSSSSMCPGRTSLRDCSVFPNFDQSAFFKKVYEEEFGVFGGSPSRAGRTMSFGRTGEDTSCRSGWPRLRRRPTRPSFPRLAGVAQPDGVQPVCRASGCVEGLRQHGICALEGLPGHRRFAVMWPSHAPSPDARTLRQDTKRSTNRLRRGRGRGTPRSTCGAMPLFPAARLTNSFASLGCALPFAASKMAAWWNRWPPIDFRTDDGDLALESAHPRFSRLPTPLRSEDWRPGRLVPRVHLQGPGLRRLLQRPDRQQAQAYDKPEANAKRPGSRPVALHAGHVPLRHYLKAMMRDKLGSTMSAPRPSCSSTSGLPIM